MTLQEFRQRLADKRGDAPAARPGGSTHTAGQRSGQLDREDHLAPRDLHRSFVPGPFHITAGLTLREPKRRASARVASITSIPLVENSAAVLTLLATCSARARRPSAMTLRSTLTVTKSVGPTARLQEVFSPRRYGNATSKSKFAIALGKSPIPPAATLPGRPTTSRFRSRLPSTTCGSGARPACPLSDAREPHQPA